jgi:hypothetical protein
MKFKSSPLGVVALVVGVDGFAGEPDGDVAIYIYIYIYIYRVRWLMDSCSQLQDDITCI